MQEFKSNSNSSGVVLLGERIYYCTSSSQCDMCAVLFMRKDVRHFVLSLSGIDLASVSCSGYQQATCTPQFLPILTIPPLLPIFIGHLYTHTSLPPYPHRTSVYILTNMNYTGVIDRFEIPVGTCVVMNFCPVSCCIAGIVALSIVPSCHAVYILSVYSPYAKCCSDEDGTEKLQLHSATIRRQMHV